ncbi:MAG: hypothetical protein OWV35_02415, partial [Firmicutes bacterium]|nr:hypothetical protein [Bacillota bacterium]
GWVLHRNRRPAGGSWRLHPVPLLAGAGFGLLAGLEPWWAPLVSGPGFLLVWVVAVTGVMVPAVRRHGASLQAGAAAALAGLAAGAAWRWGGHPAWCAGGPGLWWTARWVRKLALAVAAVLGPAAAIRLVRGLTGRAFV